MTVAALHRQVVEHVSADTRRAAARITVALWFAPEQCLDRFILWDDREHCDGCAADHAGKPGQRAYNGDLEPVGKHEDDARADVCCRDQLSAGCNIATTGLRGHRMTDVGRDDCRKSGKWRARNDSNVRPSDS